MNESVLLDLTVHKRKSCAENNKFDELTYKCTEPVPVIRTLYKSPISVGTKNTFKKNDVLNKEEQWKSNSLSRSEEKTNIQNPKDNSDSSVSIIQDCSETEKAKKCMRKQKKRSSYSTSQERNKSYSKSKSLESLDTEKCNKSKGEKKE